MKIIGLGDSLMQLNGEDTYPQEGWFQELSPFLKEEVGALDFAKNGRSSKSFIDEGIFQKALDSIDKGDLVIISFGHNDEKKEDPTRYLAPEDYRDNLIHMGNSVREKGGFPIYISSLSRLKIEQGKLVESHGDYPRMMEEAAKTLGAPFIPLDRISFLDFGNDLEKATTHFMILSPGEYPNYPKGQDDHTHLQKQGAIYVARLVKEQLEKLDVCKTLFN